MGRKQTRRRNRGHPSADRSGCVWRAERASERKVRETERERQERRKRGRRSLSQLQAAVSAWTWDEIRHWNKTGSLDYGAKSDATTGGSVSLWIYVCTLTCMCVCVCMCVCACACACVWRRKGKWKEKRMEKGEERRRSCDRNLVLVLGSIDASNAMDGLDVGTCQNVCLVLP